MGKEIMTMDERQLSALIAMANTVEIDDVENAALLDYLFSEVSACTTNACNAVLDLIPYPETYPTVYHAAMVNPTEKAFSNNVRTQWSTHSAHLTEPRRH